MKAWYQKSIVALHYELYNYYVIVNNCDQVLCSHKQLAFFLECAHNCQDCKNGWTVPAATLQLSLYGLRFPE